MTRRLYYTDPYLLAFDACVTEARNVAGRTAVLLDQSAFYPTSGGQPYDTGTLGAGERTVRITEVAEDERGDVLHFVEQWLEQGSAVHGAIDAPRRRDHMQQHTGQHVLSAAFVRLFNMPTVSFHLGVESCTIDLATSALSPAQAAKAGDSANQVISENRPVRILFATREDALSRGVRKLPDESLAEVRLIDIADFDLTPCGGTHVRGTAEIGPILLRKTEKVKQGVRVEFVCGDRAFAAVREDYATLTDAAGALSTHIRELPQQVRKMLEEGKAAARRERALLEEIAALHAAKLVAETPVERGLKLIVQHFAERDANFIRLLAQKLIAAAQGNPMVALLASTMGQPSLVFAQSGTGQDMGALLKDALAAHSGRGGGSRELAQGGVPDATRVPAILKSASELIRSRGNE